MTILPRAPHRAPTQHSRFCSRTELDNPHRSETRTLRTDCTHEYRQTCCQKICEERHPEPGPIRTWTKCTDMARPLWGHLPCRQTGRLRLACTSFQRWWTCCDLRHPREIRRTRRNHVQQECTLACRCPITVDRRTKNKSAVSICSEIESNRLSQLHT